MASFLKRISIAIGFPWLRLVAETANEAADEVIIRDVAIIGGGSSGTYAAVRLHDSGKSVVVIEKEDVLGGHTQTYRDPTTNKTTDLGVVVFDNQQLVKDYLGRLDIPWKVAPPSLLGSDADAVYVDVHTGEVINHTAPDPGPGLAAYAAQLAKYPHLETGFFLPDPVPEDLVLPFGDFVAKYPNISSAVPTIFNFGQGLGDTLYQPTLYVLKLVSPDVVRDISIGWLTTANEANHEIYDKALALLGQDVLLRSRVISTDRSANDSVKVVVDTPSGNKTIQAKKLLVAIPQKLDNLIGFDLDANEKALFGQFVHTGYYTSLVRHTGLPDNLTVISISPDNPSQLPQLPGVYSISPTVIAGLFDIKYGSPTSLPDDFVKGEIIAFLRQLRQSGVATMDTRQEPEFVQFQAHVPFELTVSPGAIQSGFYKKLYALQGRRNTYYTGAAFQTHNSFMLWNYTEWHVLPLLLNDS
ncbi:hypothetical protein VTN96DRAFT_8439 [Rasamsonia emersonii]|uniref:FAD dependent oxidoreductase family protein n=1 Tax=Rasamsonia emersonii (strain ATCC 16479 / CBS 393.64 / IMI 116815) TaxID=1408163 RepID=A0A0F4Z1N8_RASE3|nr:FAD dependent oxidoreductase family protein [Rasamsonia emersonii CBS 393.64]KKA24265.1 FAD dependent oxidoreductase family protein [Rasamsonia emersonii CBS 393.64]